MRKGDVFYSGTQNQWLQLVIQKKKSYGSIFQKSVRWSVKAIAYILQKWVADLVMLSRNSINKIFIWYCYKKKTPLIIIPPSIKCNINHMA